MFCMNNAILKKYDVIGLMSGTSGDGLDIAHCSFFYDGGWSFRINFAETIAYLDEISELLEKAFHSSIDLESISKIYGNFIGEQVNSFRNKHNVDADFIASHGHTIFHSPNEGLTLQIGDGNVIAQVCKLPVVYDFRTQDVALGGQGAPLVPVGDKLLFGNYDYCINIGGFSNISFDECVHEKNTRLAFDICPVNIILNELSKILGKEYDKNGEIAKNNKVNIDMMEELNNIEYYKLSHPKSLGKEYVINYFNPIIAKYKNSASIEEIIATYTEHAATQIGRSIKHGNALLTGGGVFNKHLINRIEYYADGKCELIIPDEILINYKEALIFAFMGVLKMREETNIYSSVTGASKDHCGGRIAGKY